jgi:hypothetical protein
VDIEFDDDFEGMEKPVVFNITNGSIGTSPSIIPLSLTRANSHLVIFSQDFQNILQDATEKGLVKKSKYNRPSKYTDMEEAQTVIGLKEALVILAGLSRRMTLESIHTLSQEWGVVDLYNQLIEQEKTRYQMINLMSQKHLDENPTTSMTQFLESLRTVNMAAEVRQKISANFNTNIDELKDIIAARNLTVDEQISLVHSLGQRSLFNSLIKPLDPMVSAVSDEETLWMCLHSWISQATEERTTEDLIKCLLKAGLSRQASEMKEKPDKSMEDSDIASFQNMSLKEKIGATAYNVFLPIITMTLTIAYMAFLYSSKQYTQFWILVFIQ